MLVIFIMNCITRTKVNTIKKLSSLDTRNRIKYDYKKLKLTDYYQYLSEEEHEEEQEEEQEGEQEEKQEETISDVSKFNKWINKKETSINTEIFTKHFNFQRPSDMFNFLNNINDIKKNTELVNVIIHSSLLLLLFKKQKIAIKTISLLEMRYLS